MYYDLKQEEVLQAVQFKLDSGMVQEVIDTESTQIAVLVKYLSSVGIITYKGLFYDACNNMEVVSLSRAVKMYNKGIKSFIKHHDVNNIESGVFLERIKLQGRSLRRGAVANCHKIKFI